MSIIGTFARTADGYAGVIRTMTINVKAKLVANDKKGNNKAPDFKVIAGSAELGAAWRAKSNKEGGREFLSVELDDPSFSAPLRAAFFDNGEEGQGVLVWSRPASN